MSEKEEILSIIKNKGLESVNKLRNFGERFKNVDCNAATKQATWNHLLARGILCDELVNEISKLRAANEWQIETPSAHGIPRIVTVQKQSGEREVTIAFYDTDDCCWIYPFSKLVVGAFDGSKVVAWTDFPAAAEVEK